MTTVPHERNGSTLAASFDDHYRKGSRGCWIWQRAVTSGGYGSLRVDGSAVQAHRFSWTRVHGRIPAGKYVLHKCDVRRCVNPSHLYLGTYGDNLRDRHRRNPRSFERGANHANAKLTMAQVRRIRASYRPGSRSYGTFALARKYRVSQRVIWRVVNRKSYR